MNSTAAALVIIDNFKGQITQSCMSLLESYNIHSCLLPPNSTDRLQPLDLSVNKPFKDVLRRKFDEWYSYQVTQQLNGRSEEEIDEYELEPVDLSMARMKEASATWFVEAVDYVTENPAIIVNGFVKSGITGSIGKVRNLIASFDEDDLSSNDADEFSTDEDDEDE